MRHDKVLDLLLRSRHAAALASGTPSLGLRRKQKLGAYIENVMNVCGAVFGSSSVVRRADEREMSFLMMHLPGRLQVVVNATSP